MITAPQLYDMKNSKSEAND